METEKQKREKKTNASRWKRNKDKLSSTYNHKMGLINEMKNKLNENKIAPSQPDRSAHTLRSSRILSVSMGIVFGNWFLFLLCQVIRARINLVQCRILSIWCCHQEGAAARCRQCYAKTEWKKKANCIEENFNQTMIINKKPKPEPTG